MTGELKEYYNTLIFKDNAKTKYYFDVIGVMTADGCEITYPIVTIQQNRKSATGAETFKAAIEQLENNSQIHSVIVNEYFGYFDDAEPISENRFKLKEKKMTKTKNGLPQQIGESWEENLKGLGSTLSLMGFENGLRGIITSTANQIAQADKLEAAKETISELKAEKKGLLDELKSLKEKNEHLKDEHKKIENRLYDLERDCKYKEERWQSKLALGTLATNAAFNILGKKFHLDDALNGLMDDEQQNSTAVTQQSQDDLDGIQVAQQKPETVQFIQEINTYLNSLDKSRISLVTAICQYLSKGDSELKDVYKYVISKSKETSTNN